MPSKDSGAERQALPAWPKRCAIHAGMFLLYLLPLAARRAFANWLAPLLLRSRAKRGHIMAVNLRYCLPHLSSHEHDRISREMIARFVYALTDIGSLWFGSERAILRRTKIVGEEYLLRAQQENRPVVLLTPHTVGMEFGGLALARRHRMLGLASTDHGATRAWARRHYRNRHADRVLHRCESMRTLLREMHNGRILYYLPDEDLGQRKRSVFVPFFGRAVNTVLGSGRLIALSSAQVLPCLTTLDIERGVYTIRIDPPLADMDYSDPVSICRRVRAELEQLIREAPRDYLWTQRMFQLLKDGSANPDYSLRQRHEDRPDRKAEKE